MLRIFEGSYVCLSMSVFRLLHQGGAMPIPSTQKVLRDLKVWAVVWPNDKKAQTPQGSSFNECMETKIDESIKTYLGSGAVQRTE